MKSIIAMSTAKGCQGNNKSEVRDLRSEISKQIEC